MKASLTLSNKRAYTLNQKCQNWEKEQYFVLIKVKTYIPFKTIWEFADFICSSLTLYRTDWTRIKQEPLKNELWIVDNKIEFKNSLDICSAPVVIELYIITDNISLNCHLMMENN